MSVSAPKPPKPPKPLPAPPGIESSAVVQAGRLFSRQAKRGGFAATRFAGKSASGLVLPKHGKTHG